MEEMKREWEVSQTNEKVKTKGFIIKYIIFVIILISITSIGIVFSIKYIDKTISQTQKNGEPVSEDNEEIEEKKQRAEDSIYAINSYSETYHTNSIEIKRYNDIDGQVIEENKEIIHQQVVNPEEFNYDIGFIQIDGLKDKVIQNKINAKLKSVPYTLKKEKYVYTDVTANFSNVLSVVIRNDIYDKLEVKTLNFDLTTGEEISFENLFISSAPIKAIIASGMYKDFAWDQLYEKYVEYDGYLDMKKTDISEVEDDVWIAVSRYNQIKDKIIYSFSPTTINIYNPELATEINMSDYANEIAIYKRYLTNESVYEKNDLENKGTIVFTEDISMYDGVKNISYGKISNNIFVEEILLNVGWTLQEKDMNIILNYVNNLSEERKTILKKETSNNKGVIFQGSYEVWKEEKGYYCINVSYFKAECSKQYFSNKAFKDYIKVKAQERVEVGLNAFDVYMEKEYPEMQISETEHKTYYLSETGEFLGNTIEEVESKVWE